MAGEDTFWLGLLRTTLADTVVSRHQRDRMSKKCDARMGWKNYRTSDWLVVDCDHQAGHEGSHTGLWHHNYPGTDGTTEVSWLEDDRRTFRGVFAPCRDAACLLPEGHPRKHSYE